MRSQLLNDDCRKVRWNLPAEMLKELDETTSSSLYQHISQCRSCLEAFIAFQAAAELACTVFQDLHTFRVTGSD